jgi:putative transcriptional regulator
MDDMEKLTHHFLLAMPNMGDPIFVNTLIFVCEHTTNGAMGLVINRPLGMTLSTLFGKMNIQLAKSEVAELPVYFGGPVQTDRGFVLHHPVGNWQSTLAVNAQIGLTTSKDILVAMGRNEGPRELFVTLGYASWEAGQLERELAQNAWLSVQAEPEIIFSLPSDARYDAALKLLGIERSMLSAQAGHA